MVIWCQGIIKKVIISYIIYFYNYNSSYDLNLFFCQHSFYYISYVKMEEQILYYFNLIIYGYNIIVILSLVNRYIIYYIY